MDIKDVNDDEYDKLRDDGYKSPRDKEYKTRLNQALRDYDNYLTHPYY